MVRRINSYGAAFLWNPPNQVDTLLHYLLLKTPPFPYAGRISPRLYASGILNIRVTGHGYHRSKWRSRQGNRKGGAFYFVRRHIHSSLLTFEKKSKNFLLTQSGIHGIIIPVAARAAAPSGSFRKELQKSA